MNEINKFIAGLNDNQKRLLVIAVVVVLIALFDVLFLTPSLSRLSSIEEDIAKEKVMIGQDIRFLGHKDRVIKEFNEIDPYITRNMSTDDEMTSAFLSKIERLKDATKVTLIKLNPAPSEQEADHWKFQADLECSGELADIITFMHMINSDNELMKVEKFNFSAKKSDTDEIKATMTIEKMVVTPKLMPLKAEDTNNVPSANPPAAS